jgi:hypothetical protein
MLVGCFFVASLGSAAQLPTPKAGSDLAANVLVDKPQQAVVWPKNGNPAPIWLVRLTPEKLSAKSCVCTPKASTWRADSGKVEAIQLSDGETFKVRPATGLFARFDPQKRAFVDEAPAGDVPGAHSLTEVAEGAGTSGDEAIRDALRNAVRKAVGVVVDGEVLVQKEDVVSDKVLTYSDGFVTEYTELSRKQENGLVRVTIRAQVEERKLLADLRQAGVTLGTTDGKGLVASAQTRTEARDAAAALLSKKLMELPNVLHVEVRPPNPLDYDAETQLLNLFVITRVDRDKYFAYADSLAPLLNKISLAKTSVLLSVLPSVSAGDMLLDWSQGPVGPVFRLGPDLQGNPKSWCLWLGLRGDDHHRTIRIGCYVLDVNFAHALQGSRGKLNVEIDLLDENQEVIARDTFHPEAGMKRRLLWLGWLAPRPRTLVANFPGEKQDELLDVANLTGVSQAIDGTMSMNAYVAPICVASLENGNILYARGVWQARALKVAPDALKRMKEIRARAVFTSAQSDKP